MADSNGQFQMRWEPRVTSVPYFKPCKNDYDYYNVVPPRQDDHYNVVKIPHSSLHEANHTHYYMK